MENINAEEILKSMYDEMVNARKNYANIVAYINKVVDSYNDNLNKLQEEEIKLKKELDKQLERLITTRDEISGQYTSLYKQYTKFTGKKPIFNDTQKEEKQNIKQNNTQEVIEEKKEEVKQEQPKQEETKQEENMSDEMIEKIIENSLKDEKKEQEEKKEVKTKEDDKINEADIPDYLRDEYKK